MLLFDEVNRICQNILRENREKILIECPFKFSLLSLYDSAIS